MTKIEEIDMMVCPSCDTPERAPQGYPSQACGTFLCIICTNRGMVVCKECRAKGVIGSPPPEGP